MQIQIVLQSSSSKTIVSLFSSSHFSVASVQFNYCAKFIHCDQVQLISSSSMLIQFNLITVSMLQSTHQTFTILFLFTSPAKCYIYCEYSVYRPALLPFKLPCSSFFSIHDSAPFFSSFCNFKFASRSLSLLLLTVKHLSLIKALWLWVIELSLYSCIHPVTGGWKQRESAHFGKA